MPGAQLIVPLCGHTGGGPDADELCRGRSESPKADGTFALTGLVLNTPVTLYAEYAGQRTNTVTIEVGPGQSRSDLVLRLL